MGGKLLTTVFAPLRQINDEKQAKTPSFLPTPELEQLPNFEEFTNAAAASTLNGKAPGSEGSPADV